MGYRDLLSTVRHTQSASADMNSERLWHKQSQFNANVRVMDPREIQFWDRRLISYISGDQGRTWISCGRISVPACLVSADLHLRAIFKSAVEDIFPVSSVIPLGGKTQDYHTVYGVSWKIDLTLPNLGGPLTHTRGSPDTVSLGSLWQVA